MALPSGSRVRLRYGDDVCDPKVRALGEKVSPCLSGMRALIAHVGFESSSTQFLPLRVGSVVVLRTVGSVTFLEVELGEFVEGQNGTAFGDLLPPIAPLQLPVMVAGAEKPSGFFCQTLSSPADVVCGDDTGLWERVGGLFLKAIRGSDAAFPYIFNISILHKRSRKPVLLRDGMLIAKAISQIEVQIRTLADKSYFGSIIQAPMGTLKITVDHPDIRLVAGTMHAIDTTRNLLISRLTTNISLRPAYGSLSVLACRRGPEAARGTNHGTPDGEADGNGSVDKPGAQLVDMVTVELPVAVGRRWVRVSAILLIAGVVAFHGIEIGELEDHACLVWGKVIVVFFATLVALFLGLKPQGGD